MAVTSVTLLDGFFLISESGSEPDQMPEMNWINTLLCGKVTFTYKGLNEITMQRSHSCSAGKKGF